MPPERTEPSSTAAPHPGLQDRRAKAPEQGGINFEHKLWLIFERMRWIHFRTLARGSFSSRQPRVVYSGSACTGMLRQPHWHPPRTNTGQAHRSTGTREPTRAREHPGTRAHGHAPARVNMVLGFRLWFRVSGRHGLGFRFLFGG